MVSATFEYLDLTPEARRVTKPPARFWRTCVADKLCLVSLAEALSRAVTDARLPRDFMNSPRAQALRSSSREPQSSPLA